ncbi:MEKHLA domain-containing protein [Dyella nitratireducens]|uniref:MEKHLA domain-containing protein n=1 Tax=Dyella nitratireducens TaxID=1849580 RepID=A0ABQ1GJL9_9GAMM|nr:MEKHLA domain-containing protein [Dyella nitratireducens]GGA44873.1 MEKHLA domain-containing protein [Dyella nitratireducens]GLQ41244.1 MEKHLA domain-containing protein [Dyella nitratireducens]
MNLPGAASTLYRLLADSYARWLGQPLVDPTLTDEQAIRWLYEEAPFGLLAHDTRADPRFIYGNVAAQRCFEYSWEELMELPSRLSAPPQQVEDRRQFLEQVSKQGFATGYRGLRISKSARTFWINDGTVWQLVDQAGVLRGQAALFRT